MDTGHYGEYVTDVKFRRALFGYRPADVDGHLRAVRGWFSLDGHRLQADAEAARIVAGARREAEEIAATARREADALVAEARREAELQRRGSSRIGRPVGNGQFARLARR